MPTDYTKFTTDELQSELEAIAGDAQARFGSSSATQLNWKPAATRWSIAQCLDHLIVINGEYEPIFEAIVAGRKKSRLLERIPGLPGWMGRMMVRSLSPGAPRKLQAPKTAVPAASGIDPQIVTRFVAHQRELQSRLRQMEAFDPARTIITSPFLALIPYSLLDTFRILVAHERRHLEQALRVMDDPRFPA